MEIKIAKFRKIKTTYSNMLDIMSKLILINNSKMVNTIYLFFRIISRV